MSGARERRPPYPAGTKERVKEKGRPPGFETVSYCFCGATVTAEEFAIHHELPWVVIQEFALRDPEMEALTPEERAEAMAHLHGYEDNLLPTHRGCNSSDGWNW